VAFIMREHHLPVRRTARYHTLGDPKAARHTWIVLHGYGQLARYFLRNFEGIAPDRYIVAPEGLSRFYTNEDHSRVGATWMTREDREFEIADQITYLDSLVDHVRAAGSSEIPVSVLGFSQGVATACRWSMGSTRVFHQVVLWGGTLPPEPTTAQLGARWGGTHIRLVQGASDSIVTTESLVRNEAQLRAAGVRYTTHHHAGGHALDRLLLQQLIGNG
jgi:predicted esterase